ncbi:40S ribosomal protein S5 [Spraguea lophii 42_110]|uniref:40S ribosomal protein S5 n=1 Tax=Spraguea lophii (strain 42_110) TaxID=1358809 RepID=S7W4M9_SPRLO|nr:Chain SF0, 40S ribosomal protein S5 [Spraguea lophii 42_110]7QJH_RF0 Chain RF0, 40S ribosomal protein S5 [Spraguea lophii 42_110]7QJH_SF0 Chain SF0, 40S ribosomal protein S5 [Spraguea lophii 42_110]8BR3_SF0 Chain SF0, 40S ribosomal protein S5 [Spraguea lophii 42_110]8P5D_SF0 Chain SF0, 40S ribosomal protein S5 [Spraguea lophii 42_110]8P60_RF0 Chain RF0, 40S ribosomal protein S5 [Spraguea lophii 42_110]8P60_SF0 Chain SF0, 40S ribosomal protein S5 [Spraguea lophii 42_110]EPR77686.1 40S ribo
MRYTETSGDIKLFGRYPYTDLEVKDITLEKYINVASKVILPHTSSRLNTKKFGRTKIPVVERFVNAMMRKGRNNGKKTLAMRIVKDAFFIIEGVTGQNPIQILVDAICNSGPREDSARIGKGGVMKRSSVDVSPLRRINIAIFLLAKGVRNSTFKDIKMLPEIIAEELINAAKNTQSSFAVKKKEEIERIAKSNR